MVEFATQHEVDNFKEFELRLLTPLDALEFSRAQNESFEQLSNYFDAEYFSKPHSFIESYQSLMAIIRSRKIDLLGLFQNDRLLGIGCYELAIYSDYGCQISFWMRTSEANKKIGTYFLKKLTLSAIYERKFRFVELLIDQSNIASRKIGSKVGYEHICTFECDTPGRLGSGKYCLYLCFDGQIDALAKVYNKRKVDLVDHPAYEMHLRHLILDEEVNEAFKWPYPVREKPKRRRPATKRYRNASLSRGPMPSC